MKQKVCEYIEQHKLLNRDQIVAIGLSGGADSVALLHVLCELGFNCVALHCNFHLRGDESLRDELFSEEFAKDLNVPFRKIDFDTTTYAREQRISIEMAARDLRYAWFEKQRIELGAQAISVAHHQNDSVETMLLNLIRGTGIKGLVGISAKHQNVVRPLLCVSREDIEVYLRDKAIGYVTDSTNNQDEFARNFIRLNVIPLLRQLNPSIDKALIRTSENLLAVASVYENAVAEKKREILSNDDRIPISKLLNHAHGKQAETILYEILSERGFTRDVIKQIYLSLNAEPGKLFYSPSWRVLKDRDELILSPNSGAERSATTAEPSASIALSTKGRIDTPVALSWERLPYSSDINLVTPRQTVYLNADKIVGALSIRKWQKGDRFHPFGMRGKKKLSDYFTDEKMSLIEKEEQTILTDEKGIAWIIGRRADERFRIKENTKEVLRITLEDTP